MRRKNFGTQPTDEGLAQSYSDAVNWYLRSAEQGQAKAQNSLGRMYAGGVGVEQDDKLAHLWFSLAAAQGEPTASKGRDAIELKMTAAQRAKAQKVASAWRPKEKPPEQPA